MPLSKAAGLPVFAIVTQGKTEHLVTIIDEKVLSKLKKGTDFSKLKEETIVIKWHSTGAKQSIKTSSMKLSDMMGGIGGGDGGDSGRRASRRGSLGSAAAVAVVAATAAVTKRKRHAGGSGSMATDDDHDEDGTLKPTKKKRPPTPSKTARKMKVTTTPVRAPSKKMKAQKKTEQGTEQINDSILFNLYIFCSMIDFEFFLLFIILLIFCCLYTKYYFFFCTSQTILIFIY